MKTTDNAQAFDLSQFETAETSQLTLLTAKGDEMVINGQPVIITLHGPGTKQQVSAQHKMQKAAKAAAVSAINGRAPKNAEQEEFERDAQYLVAVTHSISDNFPVAPLDLYSNRKLGYIAKQVNRHMNDDANFMSGSAQS